MKSYSCCFFLCLIFLILIGCGVSSSSYLKTRIRSDGKVFFLEPAEFKTVNDANYTFKPDFTINTYKDSTLTKTKMNFSLIGEDPVKKVSSIQFFLKSYKGTLGDTLQLNNAKRFLVKENNPNKWITRFTSQMSKTNFMKILKEGKDLKGIVHSSKGQIRFEGGKDWEKRKAGSLEKLSVTLNAN